MRADELSLLAHTEQVEDRRRSVSEAWQTDGGAHNIATIGIDF